MGHLGKTIDHDEHRVVATNKGKVSDEIHGKRGPSPFVDSERLKEAIWSMMRYFRASTRVA